MNTNRFYIGFQFLCKSLRVVVCEVVTNVGLEGWLVEDVGIPVVVELAVATVTFEVVVCEVVTNAGLEGWLVEDVGIPVVVESAVATVVVDSSVDVIFTGVVEG